MLIAQQDQAYEAPEARAMCARESDRARVDKEPACRGEAARPPPFGRTAGARSPDWSPHSASPRVCAEQTGLLDEDLTRDVHSLGVLALLCERGRQVAGRRERLEVIWTENASLFLERASAKSLRFCVLSQLEHCVEEVALCGERDLVVRPERASLYDERRSKEHRRLRALSEAQKRGSPVCGAGQRVVVLGPQRPSDGVQEAPL